MTRRFYMHAATTAVGGTLPGAAASVSATSPTKIASGVNRIANGIIGVLETNIVLTTNANTLAQPSMIGRWISDPIQAQTIEVPVAGTGEMAGAIQESNTASTYSGLYVVAVWRPSTGAVVGRFYDTVLSGPMSSATTKFWTAGFVPSAAQDTPVVAASGDVLIFEHWRSSQVQTMGTAYTNTYFFDGTTEVSAVSSASYFDMGFDVQMLVPVKTSPYPQILPQ